MRKRTLLSVLFFLCLFSELDVHAQTFAVITGSNLTDGAGNPVASGNLCFAPADANGNPIGVRGPGQISKRPACVPVANGVITPIAATFSVLNTQTTFPSPFCWNVTLTDQTNQSQLYAPGPYSCVQMSSSWCSTISGTYTCNWDNYPPASTASAPVSAPSLTGGTFTTGSAGSSVSCTVSLAGSVPNYALNCQIPQGVAGVAGPAGLPCTWQGSWAASNSYSVGQCYLHGNFNYLVKSAYSSGTTFGTADTTNAAIFAEGGTGTGGLPASAAVIGSDSSGNAIVSTGTQIAGALGTTPVQNALSAVNSGYSLKHYFGAQGNAIATNGCTVSTTAPHISCPAGTYTIPGLGTFSTGSTLFNSTNVSASSTGGYWLAVPYAGPCTGQLCQTLLVQLNSSTVSSYSGTTLTLVTPPTTAIRGPATDTISCSYGSNSCTDASIQVGDQGKAIQIAGAGPFSGASPNILFPDIEQVTAGTSFTHSEKASVTVAAISAPIAGAMIIMGPDDGPAEQAAINYSCAHNVPFQWDAGYFVHVQPLVPCSGLNYQGAGTGNSYDLFLSSPTQYQNGFLQAAGAASWTYFTSGTANQTSIALIGISNTAANKYFSLATAPSSITCKNYAPGDQIYPPLPAGTTAQPYAEVATVDANGCPTSFDTATIGTHTTNGPTTGCIPQTGSSSCTSGTANASYSAANAVATTTNGSGTGFVVDITAGVIGPITMSGVTHDGHGSRISTYTSGNKLFYVRPTINLNVSNEAFNYSSATAFGPDFLSGSTFYNLSCAFGGEQAIQAGGGAGGSCFGIGTGNRPIETQQWMNISCHDSGQHCLFFENQSSTLISSGISVTNASASYCGVSSQTSDCFGDHGTIGTNWSNIQFFGAYNGFTMGPGFSTLHFYTAMSWNTTINGLSGSNSTNGFYDSYGGSYVLDGATFDGSIGASSASGSNGILLSEAGWPLFAMSVASCTGCSGWSSSVHIVPVMSGSTAGSGYCTTASASPTTTSTLTCTPGTSTGFNCGRNLAVTTSGGSPTGTMTVNITAVGDSTFSGCQGTHEIAHVQVPIATGRAIYATSGNYGPLNFHDDTFMNPGATSNPHSGIEFSASPYIDSLNIANVRSGDTRTPASLQLESYAVSLANATINTLTTGGNDFTLAPSGGWYVSGLAVNSLNGVLESGIRCSSTASPALCGNDGQGIVQVASGATSVVINTTAIQAANSITLTLNTSAPGCSAPSNIGSLGSIYPSGVVAGTSFTINVGTAPTGSAACINYILK